MHGTHFELHLSLSVNEWGWNGVYRIPVYPIVQFLNVWNTCAMDCNAT